VDQDKPQSWNRYAYAYNNPLKYVDPNGKWPTAIHNAILAGAFGAGLSDSQIKALQGGSFSVDFSVRGQTSAVRAYQHGMQSPGDTPEQARIQKDIFIFEHEIAASDAAIAAGRIDSSALRELGKALHPITDATSPAHSGKTFGGMPSIPAL